MNRFPSPVLPLLATLSASGAALAGCVDEPDEYEPPIVAPCQSCAADNFRGLTFKASGGGELWPVAIGGRVDIALSPVTGGDFKRPYRASLAGLGFTVAAQRGNTVELHHVAGESDLLRINDADNGLILGTHTVAARPIATLEMRGGDAARLALLMANPDPSAWQRPWALWAHAPAAELQLALLAGDGQRLIDLDLTASVAGGAVLTPQRIWDTFQLEDAAPGLLAIDVTSGGQPFVASLPVVDQLDAIEGQRIGNDETVRAGGVASFCFQGLREGRNVANAPWTFTSAGALSGVTVVLLANCFTASAGAAGPAVVTASSGNRTFTIDLTVQP